MLILWRALLSVVIGFELYSGIFIWLPLLGALFLRYAGGCMAGERAREGLRCDEVDLLGLAGDVWRYRWLVFAVAALSAAVALVYCGSIKPVFSSQIVISPGSVKYYGSIAKGVARLEVPPGSSPISTGVTLSKDAFGFYLARLESVQLRRAFDDQFAKGGRVSLQINRGAATPFVDQLVSVSVEAEDAKKAKEYLDGYLDYSAGVALAQLNQYFTDFGVPPLTASKALFSVEKASAISSHPVKPRQAVIVLLSLFLGVVIGVMLAMVRIFFLKLVRGNS